LRSSAIRRNEFNPPAGDRHPPVVADALCMDMYLNEA